MAWLPYALVCMVKVFMYQDLPTWVGFVPSLFAKSSFSFFSFLHIINNKAVYEKINLSLFKLTKLVPNQSANLEFTTSEFRKTFVFTAFFASTKRLQKQLAEQTKTIAGSYRQKSPQYKLMVSRYQIVGHRVIPVRPGLRCWYEPDRRWPACI